MQASAFNLTVHLADIDHRTEHKGAVVAAQLLYDQPADVKLACRGDLSQITRKLRRSKEIAERAREYERNIEREELCAATHAHLDWLDAIADGADDIRAGLAEINHEGWDGLTKQPAGNPYLGRKAFRTEAK